VFLTKKVKKKGETVRAGKGAGHMEREKRLRQDFIKRKSGKIISGKGWSAHVRGRGKIKGEGELQGSSSRGEGVVGGKTNLGLTDHDTWGRWGKKVEVG